MGLFDTFKKSLPAKASAVVKYPVSAGTLDKREAALIAPELGQPNIEQRLLFVGGQPDWFRGIAKDLHNLQPNWSCTHVDNASQAAPLVESGTMTAVILDASGPVDSALVAALGKQNPPLVRIVLCPAHDRAELARWSAVGLNPLPQSSDGVTLSSNINRLIRLQEWMADAGMKKLLAQCRKLPAIPQLYSEVTAELSTPNGSIDLVAKRIAQDPVMTAKLLQVVNSAFFALGREITEPTEAVMFLGAERTRSLILLAGVFMQFENVKCPGFSTDQIWSHSLQVGALARKVAIFETRVARTAEAAFTAGLIHDMGKLILAANVPMMLASVQQIQITKKVSLREAELQVLGTTHAELTACLLGTWGLPVPVLEAVAWHHVPDQAPDKSFSLLTAVHAGNVFAHEIAGNTGEAAPEKFDHGYLESIGLGDRRNEWRQACNIPPKLEEDVELARFRAKRAAKRN